MNLIFKCPGCEDQPRKIEEIIELAIVSQIVTLNSDTEDAQYSEVQILDGLITRYQCETCGYIIRSNDNETVLNDIEDLYTFLKERQ